MAQDVENSSARPPTTFLDLPSELRNRVYFESGCLDKYTPPGDSGRGRQCVVNGDYTPLDHKAIFGCTEGEHCILAEWNQFRHAWSKAFLMVSKIPEGMSWYTNNWYRPACRRKPLKRLNVEPNLNRAMVNQPALTKASKQVREETLPIFYGNHPFVFCLLGAEIGEAAAEALKWIDTIGPANAGYLRDIRIVYSKKKRLRNIKRELLVELQKRGVKVDEKVVQTERLTYPFSPALALRQLQPRE